jgi:Anti-sigma-K factor rskA
VQHCDDETLSLLALGEPGPVEVEEHLRTCMQCAGELATLRRVVMAARDVVEPLPLDLQPVAPPPRVWDQIAAATGVQVTARSSEVIRNASAEPEPTSPTPERQTPGGPTPGRSLPAIPRQPGKGSGRRPNRSVLAVAAVSLIFGLLAGGLGTWLATGRSSNPASPQVVAATKLAGLPLAPAAVGHADVIETPQGRQLDLDVQKLGTPNGFYEVWLIDPTITKMVAIGVLNGSEGRFSLPDGVNLSSYPLLDISIQPLDGDPKHSGKSVLRGTFKL